MCLQNVHFWEKMQPGMDALGFISLTGTNMILRCRALQDCGWFPTESVTEDWELGMRMVCARVAAAPLALRFPANSDARSSVSSTA